MPSGQNDNEQKKVGELPSLAKKYTPQTGGNTSQAATISGTTKLPPISGANATSDHTMTPSTSTKLPPISDANAASDHTMTPSTSTKLPPISGANATSDHTMTPSTSTKLPPISDANAASDHTMTPSTSTKLPPISGANATSDHTMTPSTSTKLPPISDANAAPNASADPNTTSNLTLWPTPPADPNPWSRRSNTLTSPLSSANEMANAEARIEPIGQSSLSCAPFYYYFSGILKDETPQKINKGVIRKIGLEKTNATEAELVNGLETTLNKILDILLTYPNSTETDSYDENNIETLLQELNAKIPSTPIKAKAIDEVIENTKKVCKEHDTCLKNNAIKKEATTESSEQIPSQSEKSTVAETLQKSILTAQKSIESAIKAVLLSDIYTIENSKITYINDQKFLISHPDPNDYRDYFEIIGNTEIETAEIETTKLETTEIETTEIETKCPIITQEKNNISFDPPKYAYGYTEKNLLKELAGNLKEVTKQLLNICDQNNEMKDIKELIESLNKGNNLFNLNLQDDVFKKLEVFECFSKDRECNQVINKLVDINNCTRSILKSINKTYSTQLGVIRYTKDSKDSKDSNYIVEFESEFNYLNINNNDIKSGNTLYESISIHVKFPYSPEGAKLIRPEDLFIEKRGYKKEVALISFLTASKADKESAEEMKNRKDYFFSDKYFYVDGHGSPFSITMEIPTASLDAYSSVEQTDDLKNVKQATKAFSYSKRDLFVLKSIIDKHNNLKLPIVFLCCSLGAGERSFAECFSKIVQPLTVYAANSTVRIRSMGETITDLIVCSTIFFKDSNQKRIPIDDKNSFLSSIETTLEKQLEKTRKGHFRIFNYARKVTPSKVINTPRVPEGPRPNSTFNRHRGLGDTKQ